MSCESARLSIRSANPLASTTARTGEAPGAQHQRNSNHALITDEPDFHGLVILTSSSDKQHNR
jgi:hypothetical protein